MRQCMDSDNIHRRIKKIMGQLNAIDRMVDEDVDCENILIQINAAKSAIHKVGQVVLEGHLSHCVKDGIEHGDADKTIKEFAKAIEHFSRCHKESKVVNENWLLFLLTRNSLNNIIYIYPYRYKRKEILLWL